MASDTLLHKRTQSLAEDVTTCRSELGLFDPLALLLTGDMQPGAVIFGGCDRLGRTPRACTWRMHQQMGLVVAPLVVDRSAHHGQIGFVVTTGIDGAIVVGHTFSLAGAEAPLKLPPIFGEIAAIRGDAQV